MCMMYSNNTMYHPYRWRADIDASVVDTAGTSIHLVHVIRTAVGLTEMSNLTTSTIYMHT